jgi:hypothetical protein
VDRVGRQILAANSETGLQPHLVTDGSPQVEVFHQDHTELHLTEGLVKRCATDGQLAAVICQELGKMMVQREALTPARQKDWKSPPLSVPIGNASQFNAPDQTHLVELARYEQERSTRRPPRLEPRELARQYLERAGYSRTELDGVAPLLCGAEENRPR